VTDVARNARVQAIYREVNEGIALINSGWEIPDLELLCECGTSGCTDRVSLTGEEYESLRAEPTRFVLRPGHEDAEVEQVVQRAADHVIVENRGLAATIARRTDPRAASR
jgi:hypothetical protein